VYNRTLKEARDVYSSSLFILRAAPPLLVRRPVHRSFGEGGSLGVGGWGEGRDEGPVLLSKRTLFLFLASHF
jgi:hypothetical protein